MYAPHHLALMLYYTMRKLTFASFGVYAGLIGIGRGFWETTLAIVSGFSDPPGQIKEPMGKSHLN